MIHRFRAWLRVDPLRGDVALLLACLALTITPAIIAARREHIDVTLVVTLLVISCLPLALRSRWPFAMVAGTAAATIVSFALIDSTSGGMPPAACAIALYTLASRTDRRTSWHTGAWVVGTLTVSALILRPGLELLGMNLSVLAWSSLAVAIGDAVRSRRELLKSAVERAERAERTKEEEASRRVTEERMRIARELHDVVAHHITLVNAQAGVAHHLMATHPENALQALERIRDTSRSALDELRATVGLLRGSDESSAPREPAPGLADLDALVDAFHHSGLDVALERTGQLREIPALTDLTAYRIIQEALTNAHKHAGPGAARVQVELAPDAVRISVLNDGSAKSGKGDGTGHGMIGMQERAKALGGTFAAGPRPGGGFRVDAELPVRQRGVVLLPERGSTPDPVSPDALVPEAS